MFATRLYNGKKQLVLIADHYTFTSTEWDECNVISV